MEVIPVIDVRHGVAVHAVTGSRASYRPLETPLTEGSDPVAIARGLRTLYPFRTLYVADLDGIEGRGADAELQRRLAEAWSGREIWIDDGSTNPVGAARPRIAVIGSESLSIPSPRPLRGEVHGGAVPPTQGERQKHAPSSWVLSLDFRGADFLGPVELLDDPEYWPDRIIVMTLGKVGTGGGPDFEKLNDIVRRAGDRRVYAAGGVRHVQDLRSLSEAGAAGALVATALHRGQIKTGDLEEIAG